MTGSAVEAARAFIDAMVWSRHLDVWELLGPDAREHVLAGAQRRGLGSIAAERVRQGTWSSDEAHEFLRSLVLGLRVDLAGTDLSTLLVDDDVESVDECMVRCRLLAPSTLPASITGGAGWIAGVILLRLYEDPHSGEEGVWRVVRVESVKATGG